MFLMLRLSVYSNYYVVYINVYDHEVLNDPIYEEFAGMQIKTG